VTDACCSDLKGLGLRGFIMVSRSFGRVMLVLYLFLLFTCAVFTVATAQGLPESLSPATPPNDCGCPRGDNAIPVSSGMLTPFLPKIPNLELGFLHSFGNNVRTGRFTADYLLPFRLSADSVLFGEAHAEGWDFWKKPNVSITTPAGFTITTSTANNRVDLSFGGGYRTMLGGGTLLGVNGFYDTSRLFNKWYPSGGVGLEMAANIAGDDAIDLNFNWYGNLFNRDVLVNAFRNKGNSFDVEAGYSHSLFNQALDLRLKVIGYQFDIGTTVQGWRGGADLTTRNGMFTLRYEHGRDRINGDYNTVGGFVNVGFQLENLLSGESPFTLPEPVFKSPRDLRRLLGLKVKRNWHQPAAVVAARNVTNPPGPTPPGPTPLTATVNVGTIYSGGGPLLYLIAPQVSLSATAAFSTLTVTFSPVPGSGPEATLALQTNGPDNTGDVYVSGGASSVTISKATNPRCFGGGGIGGTTYFGLVLAQYSGSNWNAGLVTLTWQ
jgi:hypothetical protein